MSENKSSSSAPAEGVCPVDHSTREAWIRKQSQGQKQPLLEETIKNQHPKTDIQEKCPVDHSSRTAWLKNGGENMTFKENCSSDRLDQSLSGSSVPSVAGLSKEREVSSIPRADTGSNWVYPSQEQFYSAMKRKNWDPNAEDMKAVVPIHNAVNERAWSQILQWEKGEGSEKCGGLKLVSFQGDSKKISPKARLNMVLGYQKPFDRHDWLVDRCGTKIEYILDFYTGKPNPLMPEFPSFYIDVRPKLNTFEGCRMRLYKFLGLK